MPEQDDLDAMMRTLSLEAVAIAKDLDVELDFSAESLDALDAILDQLHQQMREGAPSDDDISMMSKLWGAYLGECLRQKCGGEWQLQKPPNVQSPSAALNVRGAMVFPTIKVYRRLTIGANENVAAFFRAVSEKISGQRAG